MPAPVPWIVPPPKWPFNGAIWAIRVRICGLFGRMMPRNRPHGLVQPSPQLVRWLGNTDPLSDLGLAKIVNHLFCHALFPFHGPELLNTVVCRTQVPETTWTEIACSGHSHGWWIRSSLGSIDDSTSGDSDTGEEDGGF